MFVDLLGWIGAALLLGAYGLVSSKRLNSTGMAYQWLNVIGAGLLVINSAYYSAYPSATLNIIWALIGLGVIGRTILRSKSKNSS